MPLDERILQGAITGAGIKSVWNMLSRVTLDPTKNVFISPGNTIMSVSNTLAETPYILVGDPL
jgi:hypothetical protein